MANFICVSSGSDSVSGVGGLPSASAVSVDNFMIVSPESVSVGGVGGQFFCECLQGRSASAVSVANCMCVSSASVSVGGVCGTFCVCAFIVGQRRRCRWIILWLCLQSRQCRWPILWVCLQRRAVSAVSVVHFVCVPSLSVSVSGVGG